MAGRFRFSAWLDRLGYAVSGLCAVHCALVPLAFALLPSLTLALLSLRDPQHALAMSLLQFGRFETWTIATAIVCATAASLVAWRRYGSRRGLACAAIGAMLLAASPVMRAPWTHAAFAVAGGIALCLAHRANLRAADIEAT